MSLDLTVTRIPVPPLGIVKAMGVEQISSDPIASELPVDAVEKLVINLVQTAGVYKCKQAAIIMTLTNLSTVKVSAPITCTYENPHSRIQIIRVITLDGALLERAVFPGQRLSFEAEPETQLEVYSCNAIGALLEDRMSCSCLGGDRATLTSENAPTQNLYDLRQAHESGPSSLSESL